MSLFTDFPRISQKDMDKAECKTYEMFVQLYPEDVEYVSLERVRLDNQRRFCLCSATYRGIQSLQHHQDINRRINALKRLILMQMDTHKEDKEGKE